MPSIHIPGLVLSNGMCLIWGGIRAMLQKRNPVGADSGHHQFDPLGAISQPHKSDSPSKGHSEAKKTLQPHLNSHPEKVLHISKSALSLGFLAIQTGTHVWRWDNYRYSGRVERDSKTEDRTQTEPRGLTRYPNTQGQA